MTRIATPLNRTDAEVAAAVAVTVAVSQRDDRLAIGEYRTARQRRWLLQTTTLQAQKDEHTARLRQSRFEPRPSPT